MYNILYNYLVFIMTGNNAAYLLKGELYNSCHGNTAGGRPKATLRAASVRVFLV